MEWAMAAATFRNPLDVTLGDPFVLPWRGRFYLYGTNDGPSLPDGRVVPVFRSDDLLHWEPLGGALEPAEPGADHWAPEVLAWNGRFYMVVSYGDVEKVGHTLWVAVADRPEGPFRLARQISAEDERFSIDGAWLLDDDGSLYLFRCLDFVEEESPPYGTGIVVQPMRDPLTPAGPPRTVLRAHAAWQLFAANRVMPLYGGRTFPEWTTIEGPAPVRRAGRVFCGYSGGNYQFDYGTGEAIADGPLGPYHDPRGAVAPLFATTPGLVEGPGHFSVVRPDLVHDWIVLHGRRPGERGRRVWLCPAHWDRDGVTIGPLTDREQAAPPLPSYRRRFDAGPAMAADGRLWLDHPPLAGAWAARVHLRLGEDSAAEAGIVLAGSGEEVAIYVRGGPEGALVLVGSDGGSSLVPFPRLGAERFAPDRWHVLDWRVEGGRAEVRLDGVVAARDRALPAGHSQLGLRASGRADFDGVVVTIP
jgi:hypothetical protein